MQFKSLLILIAWVALASMQGCTEPPRKPDTYIVVCLRGVDEIDDFREYLTEFSVKARLKIEDVTDLQRELAAKAHERDPDLWPADPTFVAWGARGPSGAYLMAANNPETPNFMRIAIFYKNSKRRWPVAAQVLNHIARRWPTKEIAEAQLLEEAQRCQSSSVL